MCGLAGIYAPDGSAAGSDIQRMADALRHRGPDDEGYVRYIPRDRKCERFFGDDTVEKRGRHITTAGNSGDSLFLGHRRLSIIDLSPAGAQPMSDAAQKLFIVFNGEIYNYLEIKEELAAKGRQFTTSTDTEVILHSYREWGTDCLHKFDGMWSFVILDLERNLLFGARDRSGVKPFYYYWNKKYLAFASEIKSLLTLPFVTKGVNEPILYDYLVWGLTENKKETFFQNIFKLPHSHYFIFDLHLKRLSIKKYYEFNYNRSLGAFEEEEYSRHCLKVKDLVLQGVSRRLRSDVPIGTCLSGGLDSSAVVVAIKKLLDAAQYPQVGERQTVFTACYDDRNIDESVYAEAVVREVNCRWFKVFPTAGELLRDLNRLIYIQDEPFGSTSIYAQYRVMQLARENGVKVVLDGQGGDEIFTGYKPYYAAFFWELLRNFRVGHFFRELGALQNASITGKELFVNMVKTYLANLCGSHGLSFLFNVVRCQGDYLNRDFLEAHRSRDSLAGDYACLSVNDLSYKLFADGHLQALLRYEDRNSMAHSIEARTPYADSIDLIEFMLGLPSIYKIHNGWSKSLLRDSLNGLLPDIIRLRRDKIGFETPQKQWFAESMTYIKDIFNRNDPYINTSKISQDCDQYIKNSSLTMIGNLWRNINFMKWNEIFKLY